MRVAGGAPFGYGHSVYRIVITAGDAPYAEFKLQDGEYVIGRAATCRIRLPEQNVSRRHARLLVNGKQATIEDAGSRYGLRVNGERVAGSRTLKADDLIELGDFHLRLKSGQSLFDGRLMDPNLEATDDDLVMIGGGPQAMRVPPMPPTTSPLQAMPPGASPPNVAVPGVMDLPGKAGAPPVPPTSGQYPPVPPPPSAPFLGQLGRPGRGPVSFPAGPGDRLSMPPRPPTTGPTPSARPATPATDEYDRPRRLPYPHARLIPLNGPCEGNEYSIDRVPLLVGAGGAASLVIADPNLPGVAFEVREYGGEFEIVDARSGNVTPGVPYGFTVAGQTVSRHHARPGDVLEFGGLTLRFVGPLEVYRPNPSRPLGEGAPRSTAAPGAGLPVTPVAGVQGSPRIHRPVTAPVERTTGSKRFLALAGGAVVIVLAAALWAMFKPKPPTAPLGGAIPTDATGAPLVDVAAPALDAPISKARSALAREQYDKAREILSALVAREPANAEATKLLATVEIEDAAAKAVSEAKAFRAAGELEKADRLLATVSDESSYAGEARDLREIVRATLSERATREGDQILSKGDRDGALARYRTALGYDLTNTSALRAYEHVSGRKPTDADLANFAQRVGRDSRTQAKQATPTNPVANSAATAPVSTPGAAQGPAKTPVAAAAPGPAPVGNGGVADATRALTGGNATEAVRICREVLTANPDATACFRVMGDAYTAMNNKAAAGQMYKKYLKANPAAADAPRIEALLR